MALLPLAVFWVLIVVNFSELGLKAAGLFVAVWLGMLIVMYATGVSSIYFTAAQAALDVVLILVIFGGDVRIREGNCQAEA